MTQNLPSPRTTPKPPPSHDIVYPSALPFALVHLACLAAIWTGVGWKAAAIGVGLYWLRIFAIGAGYHRYFSHRAYETSRAFQFVLAALAQTTAQKSVLWWAAKHRQHHLHSDTPQDVHSPAQSGFLYSHFGWVFDRGHEATDLVKIGRFRQVSRTDVAAPERTGAGGRAGDRLFRRGRPAGSGGRLLLEHRRGLSRDVQHQFGRPCRRAAALRHRRRFAQQLASRHLHHGRRLAQQPPRLPEQRPPGISLVGVRSDLLLPEAPGLHGADLEPEVAAGRSAGKSPPARDRRSFGAPRPRSPTASTPSGSPAPSRRCSAPGASRSSMLS